MKIFSNTDMIQNNTLLIYLKKIQLFSCFLDIQGDYKFEKFSIVE